MGSLALCMLLWYIALYGWVNKAYSR
jgi:hypothetical protein